MPRLIITVLCIFVACNKLSAQKNACNHLASYVVKDVNPDCYHNPDVDARTPEIIRNHGFEVEEYAVTTKKGYILALFRIPGSKGPLFIESGLMCDSSALLFAGNRSLILLLAKEGYDVWIGDYIGTIYSRGHVRYTPQQKEYWEFSFDDEANDTIPAYLEEVSSRTGQKKIVYIAHSKGYMLALMYASTNPDDPYLKAILGMSPIGYQDPIIYLKLGFKLAPIFKKVLPLLGIYAIFQYPEVFTTAFQKICPAIPHVCYLLILLVSGKSQQFPPEDLINFYSHFPSALSLKVMNHENQLIESGHLQMYDYGIIGNNEEYNQPTPPIYDLHKIKKPVFLIYAENDVVVPPRKVKEQYDDLGSEQKEMIKIPQNSSNPEDQWAHLDFLNAKTLKKELLPVILNILSELGSS